MHCTSDFNSTRKTFKITRPMVTIITLFLHTLYKFARISAVLIRFVNAENWWVYEVRTINNSGGSSSSICAYLHVTMPPCRRKYIRIKCSTGIHEFELSYFFEPVYEEDGKPRDKFYKLIRRVTRARLTTPAIFMDEQPKLNRSHSPWIRYRRIIFIRK